MHKKQGYIFDFQSNEDWKELQKLSRKKEESFSSDFLEINSATQMKSPTLANELIANSQLKEKGVFSRNDLGSSKNLQDDSITIKSNIKQQNGVVLDDLSISRSRNQSKNQWLIQCSLNQQKNPSQKYQSFQVNGITSENAFQASKGQSVGYRSTQNITNNIANTNLNIIMNLKKRVNYFIQNHTLFGKKGVLDRNPKIRKMINDKSDGEVQTTHQFFMQRVLYFFQLSGLFKMQKLKCLKKLDIPMIAPQNTWLFVWQLYSIFYNYLFMLLLSFIIIFSATKQSADIEKIIFTITFYTWVLEIFIKLNTATFYKTTLFDTRLQKLIYDGLPVVLLLLPCDQIIIQLVIFRVPIFFKIINMHREQKEIEKQLMMILDNFFYVQLMNLVINLFLVGHFIACCWYIVSIIDQNYLDNENSWIQTSLGVDGVWWKIYLNAFYWSFTLMATGSNTANTISEMFFTSVVMLFTTIIFGYMVNMIGIILEEINKLDEIKLRDINIINKYMKRKHISKDLQTRVNLDLEYLYLRSMKQKSEDEKNVLSKISPDLSNSIKIEYNRNVVSKIKCLVDNFSEETITQVCLELQEEFYSPNQIVFNENEIGDSSLMFLVSGQVDLFSDVRFLRAEQDQQQASSIQMDYKIEKQCKFIYSLKKGSVFGELNFFTGMGRKLTAKSKQFSTILKLSRESFLNIIKQNPLDFERFCEIKDKILLNSDYSPLKLSCKLCQSFNHFESSCPSSHFNKENPFLFARYNFSIDQDRRGEYNRQFPYKFHPYQNKQILQEKAELVQKNYELSQEQEDDNNLDKTSVYDEEEDYNYNDTSNEGDENSKNTYSTTNQDKDLEYTPSPEQQIGQAVSKFSLLNGFTLDDKTRKTSLSAQKYDPYPTSPRDSAIKNTYDDTFSLNIPTSQNNATNTPKAITRGTTMYQSSGDRTEFTAFMKEMSNFQDQIKEIEYNQKEMLKKKRKSKILEETRKRFSIKTDYSKKQLKNSSILKKSSYFDRELLEADKFKTRDGFHKLSTIHNESSNYEKLLTNSLWNFDNVGTFTNYFPNGNYIIALNRYNQLRKKYLKKIQSNNNNSEKQKHLTIKKKQ